MRTAKAYTAKLNAEALGRTFKVQDTNHRAFTTTLYRGAAGCGPVNYTQLNYVEPCFCNYLQTIITPPENFVYDGGTPLRTGRGLNGGSVSLVGSRVFDGGNP